LTVFICDESRTPLPSPSITKKPNPTNPITNNCFTKALDYEFCNDNEIATSDESDDWIGILRMMNGVVLLYLHWPKLEPETIQ